MTARSLRTLVNRFDINSNEINFFQDALNELESKDLIYKKEINNVLQIGLTKKGLIEVNGW